MVTTNQIMGVFLIALGTAIMGLLAIWGRRYEYHPENPFSHRFIYAKSKDIHFGITPEQIEILFGTFLIIIGTILTTLSV